MSGSIVQFRPTVGYDYEQLTVTTGVQVLTPAKYTAQSGFAGASEAFLTLNGGNIRYKYNGGTPSSTEGHVLLDGGILVLKGQQQMKDFKCIRTGSADSEISVTYERE
jgi:hypothetical protein